MSTSFLAICLGVGAVGFSILLWAYWALVFPIIRRQLKFRLESYLDRLRLLGLKNEVPMGGKLYATMDAFLSEAAEVAAGEGWISMVNDGPDEVRDRRIRLSALQRQMDEEHFEMRKLFEHTMEGLLSLYVAQRPFAVCVLVPILVCGFFMQRAKSLLVSKEIEYAAGALARI